MIVSPTVDSSEIQKKKNHLNSCNSLLKNKVLQLLRGGNFLKGDLAQSSSVGRTTPSLEIFPVVIKNLKLVRRRGKEITKEMFLGIQNTSQKQESEFPLAKYLFVPVLFL